MCFVMFCDISDNGGGGGKPSDGNWQCCDDI